MKAFSLQKRRLPRTYGAFIKITNVPLVNNLIYSRIKNAAYPSLSIRKGDRETNVLLIL